MRAATASIHVTGDPGAPVVFLGTLQTRPSREFRMDFHGLHNQGQIGMIGGSFVAPLLRHEGALTVNPLLVSADDATLETSVVFADGSSTTIRRNARLIIDGSAHFESSAVVSGGGELLLAVGSTATGNAQIGVDLENRGSIEPGASLGTFHVRGDFSQRSSGSLLFEIAGTTPGTEYDRLIVDDSAAFDGDLIVDLDPAYLPVEGDAFDLLDFRSVTGKFDTLDFDALPAGLFWNVSQLYLDGIVSIVALSADFDLDGDVDASDRKLWEFDYGGPGSDSDGDNLTGGDEFLAWQREFGRGVSPPARLQPVPEPAGIAWLAIGLVLGVFKR